MVPLTACPSCHAAAGPGHRVLHHFPCAYVGPEYDYAIDDDGMVCPKCRRALVAQDRDFEVLGASFRCDACGKEFVA